MTTDQWQKTKDLIMDRFKIENSSIETFELENSDPPATESVETIEFVKDGLRFRLEYIIRPRMLDKKTNYSNRIGGQVQVKMRYDLTDLYGSLHVYRWQSEDWQELDKNILFASQNN